jgi:hypothetical protein
MSEETRLQFRSGIQENWFQRVDRLGKAACLAAIVAASVRAAVEKHAFQLIGNKGMSTLANRRRLADRLSVDQPVAIEGIRNVWCCSASVGKKFALVNIVATA